MGILIFIIVWYILLSISLYMLFPLAGKEAWRGLVPVLNYMEWCDIVGRSKAYAFLMFIPIVNFFIHAGLAVDMVRSFGKFSFGDAALAVAFTPISFFKLTLVDKATYEGPVLTKEQEYATQIQDLKEAGKASEAKRLEFLNPYKRSAGREWIESVVFAVFAAAFIRLFLVEAFVIPTPSMEGSLLVGDFLFVSKAHYGMRMPMTVAMIPLLHNVVPVIGGESYLKSPSLPYKRLPAIEDIDLNDPIVFNWPVGDSVYISPRRTWTVSQVKNNPGIMFNDPVLQKKVREKDFVVRPIDKKDHYIKRCLAIPGDSLEIIDRQVYINGQAIENPEKMQFNYVVRPTLSSKMIEKVDIENADIVQLDTEAGVYALDEKQVSQIKKIDAKYQVELYERNQGGIGIFPNDTKFFGEWTVDNFGPIYIPEAGASVVITPKNLPLYRRIISVYENNDLEVKNGRIFINGKQTTSYTFKQDYYWAMGDNRHNSEDSRMWGYVPHDHIVGKPLFIWMSSKNGSISNGIRWNRVFSTANKM